MYSLALVWHGDRAARDGADLDSSRFGPLAAALRAVGVRPEAAVYNDDFADDVREQLLAAHGALVWVNPIEQGRDRTVLDGVLREVVDAGVFVSAHPDTILAMGTKEVLVRTRGMTWGSDCHLYATAQELRDQLPSRLEAGRARVLKQYRGNGGNGVWKVELDAADRALVRLRHALRGSVEVTKPLAAYFDDCELYFASGGCLIDQEYQERLVDGMVRCYLVGSDVVGFGRQEINALFPAPAGRPAQDAPQPGPRLYHPANAPPFQHIRQMMEREWLDDLCRTLQIDKRALPLIWDADFLYGPTNAAGEDTYVLCEINVSSVYPYPDSAIEPLALAAKERLAETSTAGRRSL